MTGGVIATEAFKLKARLYTFAVIELQDTNIQAIKTQLSAVYQQAPNMFSNTPVVIDAAGLKGASFDLSGVCEAMREHHMIPVAIQGTSVVQRKAATHLGLSIISSSQHKEASDIQSLQTNAAPRADVQPQSPTKETKQDESRASREEEVEASDEVSTENVPLSTNIAKVITTPVRSGQQIYAKDADLIVLSSVGQGAELLADGHIHVYGALRGRALAGINGNEKARIFCSKLDAELLSIAGCYVMPDNHAQVFEGSQQVFLQDGRLQIKAM